MYSKMPIELRRDRPRWGSRIQLYLVMIAFSLSPFSVWKFPLQYTDSGRSASLIPYVIVLLTVGVPLVHLEISLGRFMQRAGPSVWGVVPILKGLSWAGMAITLIKISTNLAVVSWIGHYIYLIASGRELYLIEDGNLCIDSVVSQTNETVDFDTGSLEKSTVSLTYSNTNWDDRNETGTLLLAVSLADEVTNISCSKIWNTFFREALLESSQDIGHPGVAVMPIFISIVLAVAFISVFIVKGVKWTGRVLAFSVVLSLVLIISIWVFIIYGDRSQLLSLDESITYLITPELEALLDPKIWLDSVIFVLLTLGVGLNVLPTLSSYTRTSSDTVKDAWIFCLLATMCNIFTSWAVLCLIGEARLKLENNFYSRQDPSFIMAPFRSMNVRHQYYIPINYVLSSFIILLTTANSAILTTSVVSSVEDISKKLAKWRQLIMIGVLACAFLVALPLCLQNGIYLFRLLDYATCNGTVIGVVCVAQCLGISWIYGGSRLYDNLEMMHGNSPNGWMKFSWAISCPLLVIVSVGHRWYTYPSQMLNLGDAPEYASENAGPTLLTLLLLMALVLLPIPFTALFMTCKGGGSYSKRIRNALKPRLGPHQIPVRWRLEGKWHKFDNKLI